MRYLGVRRYKKILVKFITTKTQIIGYWLLVRCHPYMQRKLMSFYLSLVLIIVGCGGQGSTKGSVTAAGAVLGTAAMPGFGTAVVAGVGWGDERAVNKGEAQSHREAIRDEVQKQIDLQQKLLAQGLHYSNITENMTKEFASEIEKGRLAIFDNGAGLNLYLNETFFFPQAKTLSKEGRVIFHKIYEKISPTPQVLFIVEDSNDSRKNDSGQNIWSVASFLHQKMPLKPKQVLVKSNGKLLNISRKAAALPPKAYSVRIILISPST